MSGGSPSTSGAETHDSFVVVNTSRALGYVVTEMVTGGAGKNICNAVSRTVWPPKNCAGELSGALGGRRKPGRGFSADQLAASRTRPCTPFDAESWGP